MISSFICCRAGEVEHLDIRSSLTLLHIFLYIYVRNGSVLSRCRPEDMWCDAAFRMLVRKVFSPLWQLVGSSIFVSLSSISLLYRSQFVFFRLMLGQCCIGLIVTSICKLMRIGRWSEPWLVFVFQLVEVIKVRLLLMRHYGNLGWRGTVIQLVNPS